MSRPYDDEDDDRPRSRDHHRRQHSPDYYYAGGAPPPYASGAMPAPPPGASSRARLQYEPQSPLYNPNTSNPDFDRYGGGLQVPSSRHRPRSVPPPMSGPLATRSRRGSRSPSPSRDRDPHSPLGKARHALNSTFTPSTSGLGVGVLGAIVGGLAAREVSEAAARNKDKSSHQHSGSGAKDEDRDRARLVSTLIGAAVGGLGANALEKRLEKGRKEDKDEQEAWERKWGRHGRDDRSDYDYDRGRKDHGRGDRKSRYDDRYDDDHNDDDDDDYGHVYRDTQLRKRRSDDGFRGRY